MAINAMNTRQQVTTPAILKEQRARDAAQAIRDYQAERIDVLARSQRLRALRLAAKSVPGVPAKAAKARMTPVR
jgi:hypothetical protein